MQIRFGGGGGGGAHKCRGQSLHKIMDRKKMATTVLSPGYNLRQVRQMKLIKGIAND